MQEGSQQRETGRQNQPRTHLDRLPECACFFKHMPLYSNFFVEVLNFQVQIMSVQDKRRIPAPVLLKLQVLFSCIKGRMGKKPTLWINCSQVPSDWFYAVPELLLNREFCISFILCNNTWYLEFNFHDNVSKIGVHLPKQVVALHLRINACNSNR